MKLVTVTAPSIEPVTIAEARDQCWLLSDTTHDTKLTRLISSARSSIEALTGIRCIQQTVRLELNEFPGWSIDLGCYPVQSITSLVYDDENGTEQTLVAGTGYWSDLGGMYPRLSPVTAWPATHATKPACIRITMVVGYANAAGVPPDLRDAILQRVAERFEHASESVEAVTLADVPLSVRAMIAPHCRGVT
jgi:uncharacterized phiE125 gp8 family phage protein